MLGREGPLARVAREEALSRASPWPAHVLGAVKENPAAANSAESDGLGPFAIEEHNKRQLLRTELWATVDRICRLPCSSTTGMIHGNNIGLYYYLLAR
ncbi:uncharacterized protein LOC120644598 isoform X2 [Panicum virgatum]|uniref:uncharacterized protein LOC120644598 isoform X2 n=1 Tax=Panicum virgatum TaxID=38727 RepID=UPI0019D60474|nr:uncharacterized protein LOC120644598 isoform X2 [Panicum virgatum]